LDELERLLKEIKEELGLSIKRSQTVELVSLTVNNWDRLAQPVPLFLKGDYREVSRRHGPALAL